MGDVMTVPERLVYAAAFADAIRGEPRWTAIERAACAIKELRRAVTHASPVNTPAGAADLDLYRDFVERTEVGEMDPGSDARIDHRPSEISELARQIVTDAKTIADARATVIELAQANASLVDARDAAERRAHGLAHEAAGLRAQIVTLEKKVARFDPDRGELAAQIDTVTSDLATARLDLAGAHAELINTKMVAAGEINLLRKEASEHIARVATATQTIADLKQTVAHRARGEDERERQIADLERQRDHARSLFGSQHKSLTDSIADLRVLAESVLLGPPRGSLAEAIKDLVAHVSSVRYAPNAEIDRLRVRVVALQNDAVALRAAVEEREKTIARKRDAIRALEIDHRQTVTTLTETRAVLFQRTEQLTALRGTANELRAQLRAQFNHAAAEPVSCPDHFHCRAHPIAASPDRDGNVVGYERGNCDLHRMPAARLGEHTTLAACPQCQDTWIFEGGNRS